MFVAANYCILPSLLFSLFVISLRTLAITRHFFVLFFFPLKIFLHAVIMEGFGGPWGIDFIIIGIIVSSRYEYFCAHKSHKFKTDLYLFAYTNLSTETAIKLYTDAATETPWTYGTILHIHEPKIHAKTKIKKLMFYLTIHFGVKRYF